MGPLNRGLHWRLTICLLVCRPLVAPGQLLVSSNAGLAEGDKASAAEPAFPSLFDWRRWTVTIVSEIIDESDASSLTLEEYVDLSGGRAAFVTSSKLGYYVNYQDSEEGLSFTYRPYKCRLQRIGQLSREVTMANADGIAPGPADSTVWTYNMEAPLIRDSNERVDGPNQPKRERLRLFGVAALWELASKNEKSFRRAQFIYSASSKIYRESLLWTVSDHTRNITVKLYFMEHGPNPAESNWDAAARETPPPTLEMVQVESRSDSRLLRTINILSIERTISEQVYKELLSPPLGYGCFSALSDQWAGQLAQLEDEIRQRRTYSARYADSSGSSLQAWSGHAELEVTATKFEHRVGPNGEPPSRSSETFSVELAQAKVRGMKFDEDSRSYVKMVRWRNTFEDKKVVLRHNVKVKYELDMRQGSCKMSHIQPAAGAPAGEAGESAYDQVLLQFRTKAQLDLNLDLFREADDLHFIKRSAVAGRHDERHYYEGRASVQELAAWFTGFDLSPDAAKRTRVIRTYDVMRGGGEDQLDHSLELSSVTIWLLDEQQANILLSYQIYVIDLQTEPAIESSAISNLIGKAKLFDLSQECYLENDAMVQGRDYIWYQLTYPASSRLLGSVAANWLQLKQTYYEKFVGDFMRVPKVEFLLEEDKFKIRTLMVDLPSIELIYDEFPQVELVPNQDDLNYMAPDLTHCSHLCKVHFCTIMSYNDKTKACVLSSRPRHDFKSQGGGSAKQPVELKDNFVFSKRTESCKTYKVPAQLERGQFFKTSRLSAIIASLQHQNYEPRANLPPVPDEVSLPTSESGLSDKQRLQAYQNYFEKLKQALEKEGRLPSLAFHIQLAGSIYFLLPSKFELESDPLDEFGLHKNLLDEEADGWAEDSASVPHFHKGILMSRYNLARVATLSSAKSAETAGLSFNSMRGLTYDQCALACWDSKCGTFSYCQQGRECVLTSVNSTGRAQALEIVEPDVDCFIAQRDFLGQFVKFPDVPWSQVSRSGSVQISKSNDPSECALDCVSTNEFRCRSFEFCPAQGRSDSGQCFFQTERYLTTTGLELPSEVNRCDHYSRSHLADFIRVDSRRVSAPVLDQLQTSTFEGLSVFNCAERCANELPDCTGFQFCHQNFDGSDNESKPERQCVTIESKVTLSMLASLGGNTSETVVDERSGGEVVKTGNYLTYDLHCQVFSMRKDSSEAHLRDLAFGGLIRALDDDSRDGDTGEKSPGLTIFSGILLYLGVVLVSATVACSLLLLRDNNELVKQRVERLRLVMGI